MELIPSWLCGEWSRRSIRRFDETLGELGPPDESVNVCYLQAPTGHFVDVRIGMEDR